MRQRLLASFRAIMALFLMAFATNIAPIAATVYAAAGAVDDSAFVQQNSVGNSIDVTANDTGEKIDVTGTSSPTHGTVTIHSNKKWVSYTPSAGYVGSDSFTYTIKEKDTPSTSTATVNIVVRAPLSIPTLPLVNDPCGPANATYILPSIPNVTFSVNAGKLIATAAAGYLFTSGSATAEVGPGTPTDSGAACDSPIPIPALPSVIDECGVGNARYDLPVIANVTFSVVNGRLMATAGSGFVFEGGSKTADLGVGTPADNGNLCDEVIPALLPDVIDPCGLSNATYDLPAATAKISYSVENGRLYATAGAGFVFAGDKKVVDLGVSTPADSGKLCPAKGKVTLCHATGSESNPFVKITVSVSAAYNGHYGNSHQDGEDIIPPFEYDGHVYSQNWDEETNMDKCVSPDKIRPEKPVRVKMTCEADGSYTIPSVEHVRYFVDEDEVEAGTYTVDEAGTVHITAVAEEGYELKGKTSWTLKFKEPKNCECPDVENRIFTLNENNDCGECPSELLSILTNDEDCEGEAPEEPVDVCSNIPGDQATVPEDMVLVDEDKCVTPGRGGEETPPTSNPTAPIPGEVLSALTTTSTPAPVAQEELADTGESNLASILVAFGVMVMALGLGFTSRKQRA